jgi:histidinol-phosphate phosphatase family protein
MKLVILDRDGTINHEREDYIKSPEEWVPLPGALEAIARLNHAGWHVVVATNQSGIGRGLFDMVALNAMHAKMNQMLAKVGGRVEAVFFCPHTPEDHCTCRKPMPGLFQMIGQRFGRSLDGVPMVGDLPRDVSGGAVGGVRAPSGAHRPGGHHARSGIAGPASTGLGLDHSPQPVCLCRLPHPAGAAGPG